MSVNTGGARPDPSMNAIAEHDTGLRSFEWADRYSSSRQDLVGEFFGPALDRAVRYDRAAGYFRSTVYSLIAEQVRRFVARRGEMRLICSPELRSEDIAALPAAWTTAAMEVFRYTARPRNSV